MPRFPAFSLLFFLERKEGKRKSNAGKLSFAALASFANALHKTDGSYMNRPFFRSMQDVRKSVFSQINQLSRSVFCFFSSRKEIVPFLFFLERKGSKRKSSAEQLLFAAVVFFANMLHKTDGSHTNRPFFRSWQNARESIFSQINQLSRYVFCFFSSRKEIVPFQKKRNRSLSEEKNRPPITSTARRGSRRQPSCPRPLRGSRSQRRSQRLRPHTRTACSSCRSPHRQ